MPASSAPWLLLCVLLFGSCAGPRAQQPDQQGRAAHYRAHLAVLSAEDRAQFAGLGSDEARDLFLAERGADVKLLLVRKLRQGMEPDGVRAALGPALDEERTWEDGKLLEYWTYRRPNPAGETRYTIRFAGGKLAGWEVTTSARN